MLGGTNQSCNGVFGKSPTYTKGSRPGRAMMHSPARETSSGRVTQQPPNSSQASENSVWSWTESWPDMSTYFPDMFSTSKSGGPLGPQMNTGGPLGPQMNKKGSAPKIQGDEAVEDSEPVVVPKSLGKYLGDVFISVWNNVTVNPAAYSHAATNGLASATGTLTVTSPTVFADGGSTAMVSSSTAYVAGYAATVFKDTVAAIRDVSSNEEFFDSQSTTEVNGGSVQPSSAPQGSSSAGNWWSRFIGRFSFNKGGG